MTDLTPGYNVDLMSYLFGAILSVANEDIYGMAVVLVCVTSFCNPLLQTAFSDEF